MTRQKLAGSAMIILGVCLPTPRSQGAPIHQAAAQGDLALIEGEVERGRQVDARMRQGLTPLMVAARSPRADVETVNLLLSLGADISATDNARRRPLHHAALGGDAARIGLLLLAGSNPEDRDLENATPLMLASSRYDGLDAVRALIEGGADVNSTGPQGQTALKTAILSGRPAIVEALLAAGTDLTADGENESTPLHLAASRGESCIAELLIDAGADIEAKGWQGWTPLLEAISGGSAQTVNLLLERGASLEGIEWPPLCEAVVRDNEEGVRAAIEGGADVNERDQLGRTAVMYAGMFNRAELVRILVEAGAEVNITDGNREPAIMLAVLGGPEGLQAFIDAGADVNARGIFGMRPIHAAINTGDPARVSALVEGGASFEVGEGAVVAESPLALGIQTTPEMVDALIELGVDVNADIRSGATALHLAAGDDEIPMEIMTSLIAGGGDLAATDRQGLTPLDYAVRSARPERVRLLLEMGAVPRETGSPSTLLIARMRFDDDPYQPDVVALIEKALETEATNEPEGSSSPASGG